MPVITAPDLLNCAWGKSMGFFMLEGGLERVFHSFDFRWQQGYWGDQGRSLPALPHPLSFIRVTTMACGCLPDAMLSGLGFSIPLS